MVSIVGLLVERSWTLPGAPLIVSFCSSGLAGQTQVLCTISFLAKVKNDAFMKWRLRNVAQGPIVDFLCVRPICM